jgi:drug/metabolite transporter (DMT)-like permease
MGMTGVSFPRDGASWRAFAFQALLNSVVPFTLIAWGQKVVEAGLATILNSTAPIFTFVLTWGMTRHEPVGARKLAGVVLGLAGVVLIVGVQALASAGTELWSQLAIVAATVCYAGAAIFGRSFSNLPPIVPAAGSMLCGAAILIPASLLVDQPWTLAPSARSLGALAGLSVFSTALAFLFYFRLINTLGSVGTTAQAYVRVPIGVAIGVVFLGESPSPTAWIGLACVVLGVAAMTMPRRAPA